MIVIGLSTNKDTKTQADMPKDYVKAVLRINALPVILPMIPEMTPIMMSSWTRSSTWWTALFLPAGRIWSPPSIKPGCPAARKRWPTGTRPTWR